MYITYSSSCAFESEVTFANNTAEYDGGSIEINHSSKCSFNRVTFSNNIMGDQLVLNTPLSVSLEVKSPYPIIMQNLLEVPSAPKTHQSVFLKVLLLLQIM